MGYGEIITELETGGKQKMLDKLIRFEEVCLTIGTPTGLGFLLLIALVIVAAIGYGVAKR